MDNYKIKYKTKYPKERKSDQAWERIAIEYATWLARKRGIELPQEADGYRPRTVWDGVTVYTSTDKPRYDKRIRAVEWGCEVTDVERCGRSTRVFKRWETELTIELPHWDFVPEVFDNSAPHHVHATLDFRAHCADFNRWDWERRSREEALLREACHIERFWFPDAYAIVVYRHPHDVLLEAAA